LGRSLGEKPVGCVILIGGRAGRARGGEKQGSTTPGRNLGAQKPFGGEVRDWAVGDGRFEKKTLAGALRKVNRISGGWGPRARRGVR